MNSWIEGEDFYYNEQGFIVLTARYHLDRGHCCGNGCRHCPYKYINVPDPKRSELLASPTSRTVGTGSPKEGLNNSK
jgi:Family of unknown function (DUF5522)